MALPECCSTLDPRIDSFTDARSPYRGDSMRNATGIVTLAISIAFALIGCSRDPSGPTAASAAKQAVDSQATLVCPAGQRVCIDCNGNQSCATRCTFPACPAPVAPDPGETAIAELAPVTGEQCGGVVCGAGLHCCNPSCNHCTPKGVECSQESCN
jgi:hypothetical protein